MKDDYDHYEKQLLDENVRAFKKERKLYTKQDRSKYKKTDQKKLTPTAATEGEHGRVISLEPSLYHVFSEGKVYACSLKGTMKHEKTRQKNLIAIGDFVRFTPLGEKQGLIISIDPRTSTLSRVVRNNEQVIAANVDQVLIIASVGVPPLKHALIDRYIIATQKGNMKPVVVINKIDLLPPDDTMVQELEHLYEKLSIPFIKVSAVTREGLEELAQVMEGKTSVLSGQSGVGKSSLINEITSSSLRVGEVIEKTGKGAHTTTKATLVPLSPSGFCIDTPGIKSFGLWELTYEDVQDYFSDFAPYQCKYRGCTHIHEPECKVQEAVEEGKISLYRYQSYSTLIEEVQNGNDSTN